MLPPPKIGSGIQGGFPFENYRIVIPKDALDEGQLYLQNLFEHLIAHYIFCPRSLETAGRLALSSMRGISSRGDRFEGDMMALAMHARRMVNIFTDIVADSFRLERSMEDEELVCLGWRRLSMKDNLSALDRAVISFLSEFWSAHLGELDERPPEALLLQSIFSPGIRDRSLWPRQCQQMSRALAGLEPGLLGKGQVRTLEILFGNADAVPMESLASALEPGEYGTALSVLGLKYDLKRWYRDQAWSIEIKPTAKSRTLVHPSGFERWRLSDPLCELDVNYSMSISSKLIPGVTTYRRGYETSTMSEGEWRVPDLLVVLDSSKSMDGHGLGTKTRSATIAAFKACSFAHSRGAMVSAINFSDRYMQHPWTRDMAGVEDVLVEYICGRTNIPGKAILDLAMMRPGCLILCITDTHIQNMYAEWDNLVKASKFGEVYYINSPNDLLALVVETAKRAYGTDARDGEP
jgi:hypothetical protein